MIILYITTSKRCVEACKVALKALRWNVLFFFDAHAVLFPLSLLSGFLYKRPDALNCVKVTFNETQASIYAKKGLKYLLRRTSCRQKACECLKLLVYVHSFLTRVLFKTKWLLVWYLLSRCSELWGCNCLHTEVPAYVN